MTVFIHVLTEVGSFDGQLGAADYCRWYCSCGSIGGRRGSKKAAVEDWNRHALTVAYIRRQQRPVGSR